MSEPRRVTLEELREAVGDAITARRRMASASDARFRLPPGSSRARVTSANARHANACEAYDRYRELLVELLKWAIETGIPYHQE